MSKGRKEKDKETGQIWNYELKTVYFIGVLDFIYDKNAPNPILIREVSLKDQFGKEFYEKLQLIYIQMPLFSKKESELVTRRDKWLYFLKYLPSLEHIPAIMKEKVFQKAFHTAEVASMSEKERAFYEQAEKDYLSYWATITTAEKKGLQTGIGIGRAEGKAEGKDERSIEIARNMKKEGFDVSMIVKMTGLTPEEIERLE